MIKRIILMAALLCILILSGCSGEGDPALEPLEGDISAIADDFLACLVEGDYSAAYAYFSAEVRNKISESDLQAIWQQMGDVVGPYLETDHRRHEVLNQEDVITIIARFEIRDMDIMLVFDDHKRISGLWLNPDRGDQ